MNEAERDVEGPCEKCGSDHGGYPSGSLGAELRCLTRQADELGASHLVDQLTALRRDLNGRRNQTIGDLLEWLMLRGFV